MIDVNIDETFQKISKILSGDIVEILPCPFCGSHATMDDSLQKDEHNCTGITITCDKFRCWCSLSTSWFSVCYHPPEAFERWKKEVVQRKENLIKQWNTRHTTNFF